ncbi:MULTISPECIES: pyrroline-5-carboxylate reductase [unclassified Paenibacillus]|uniref:pyrroline-5-carboxylate reductase n=1 Tax=unclassified Paenibacillus TaxID=185978 RepID=UPI000955C7E6|nr:MULTISPECIES: pyrroline-5-carboxylate reductase [unclassified Paenibacillus]SIQ45007.1 pyrroline-5-carboxylate reductase [Paenibacillus sp. RU4X]SIQ67253.1 pyrroline-5-carboxylate reductase [Paenibacillus sp. RU4T]
MTTPFPSSAGTPALFAQPETLSYCFFGAGSMAEAVARGMISRGLCGASRIGMFNRSGGSRLAELRSAYGVLTAETPEEKEAMLAGADVIVLSMKPKDAEEALRSISHLIDGSKLIVSLIAGLSISTIQALVGTKAAVARTMPNTSSTIGLGATALSYSPETDSEQRAAVEQLFRSIGLITVVEERLLEAVTGLSGSGPAYLYYIMEAMIEAGMEMGLDGDSSRELTVQTVLGAAEMMRVTGEQPAELRRKVTSPNGTTQAAIQLMQEHRVAEFFKAGMKKSAQRADEIGREIERSVLGEREQK